MKRVLLSMAWVFAVACGSATDVSPGLETGPCLEGACLQSLSCLSDLCVDASSLWGSDGSVEDAGAADDSPSSTTTNGTSTIGDNDSDGWSTGGTYHDVGGDPTTSDPTGNPQEVNVINHTGVCGGIVWCTDEFGYPTGPHAFAECFTDVPLAPPYDVVEVRYSIGEGVSNATSIGLEVRSWSNHTPGIVIGSRSLTSADMSVGLHAIVLSEPIRVDASGFCVALHANSSFAVRRDVSNPVAGHAFVRADDCDITEFVSLESLANGELASNLCMSARIRAVD